MTQLKPTDLNNSVWLRTVLLATDSSHTIINEVVDGKNNAISYCAYGEQSAQRDVVGKLGFNGQLREANISWYLLGKGYRAYNPRLMRFHSPDSWSPFGGGGLNAYMYCVGDPINRSDPTGHAPLFPGLPLGLRKFVSGVDKFFFGGSGVTGPNRTKSLTASAPLGPMRPEKTGELKTLMGAGAIVGGAPGPRGNGSPAIGEWGSTTSKRYPGYEGAAQYRSNHHASRPASHSAGSRNAMRSSASGGDQLPSYKQAMSLWNADTFAASQNGRKYMVNTAALPKRNHFDGPRPLHMAQPNPRPPTPPSSSSSSAISRDSTAPGSPRNRGGANNPPNFDDLTRRLTFIRR